MKPLPPNCVSRRELQALIGRATDNALRSNDEFSSLLQKLAAAAASVEGYLSEQSQHIKSREYENTLANPHQWKSLWACSQANCVLSEGDFHISFGQQLVFNPHLKLYYGTSRYRLYLGNEKIPESVLVEGDTDQLRYLVSRYMSRFAEVPLWIQEMAEGIIQRCGHIMTESQRHAV